MVRRPPKHETQVALVEPEAVPEPVSAQYLLDRYDQSVLSHFIRLQKLCPGRSAAINLREAMAAGHREVLQSDAQVAPAGKG